MSLPVMFLNFQWLQMSLRILCLISVRSLVLWIFPCIPQCFHLIPTGSCKSIWMTLWTSLQVSMPHPRHHSSWTGTLLPFLLGYFFIVGRICINDVAHQCHITRVCLMPCHSILHFGLFLELSSLVLRNKSSFFFACKRLCMRSFLQFKCICMVRNIS